MKKKVKWLLVLVGLLAGAGLGILLVTMLDRIPGLSPGKELALYVFSFVVLHAFFLVELILHEAGHLLFGLMTGWRFVSFRVGSVLWLRQADGTIRRRKFSLAGTAGQCLLAPPPWREEGFPCLMYNLGGVIVNLATAAICGLLAWAFWDHPLAALLLMEAAFVGLLLGVTNGVPLPGLAVANDGSNVLSMRESRDARRALWSQMSVAAAQAEGQELRDMPDEWFAPFPEEAMDNPLVASVAVFEANRRLNALDLPGTEVAVRALLRRKQGVLPLYQSMLTLDGACCELLAGRPGDLTDALQTPAVQQIMKAMKTNPSVLRTRYIVALLADHDEAAAAKALTAFDKVADTYPYPQDLPAERALMDMAWERAQEASDDR